MIIRIPNDYKTVLDLLDRHGIPYTVEKEEYKDALSQRAETLHDLDIINLNNVDFDALINDSLVYLNDITRVNHNTLEHLFNESLRTTYNNLIDKYE